jgi:formylglycine-generating enzyme
MSPAGPYRVALAVRAGTVALPVRPAPVALPVRAGTVLQRRPLNPGSATPATTVERVARVRPGSARSATWPTPEGVSADRTGVALPVRAGTDRFKRSAGWRRFVSNLTARATGPVVLTLALWLGSAMGYALEPQAGSVVVPAGRYAPLILNTGQPKELPVPSFSLDQYPVTNAQFLAFVRANPRWRRSQVSRLFADRSYLEHWLSDLEPGPGAPLDAPVVRVSWFAARAYARSCGKRLPSTAEWERAASAGFTQENGKADTAYVSDLYAWLSRPTPAVHSAVTTARANFFGIRGLHGLVWEWVEDFNTALVTGESRADSSLEKDLFCGAGAASSRDTSDYAAYMRLALRSSLKANNTTSSLGFRCAADL